MTDRIKNAKIILMERILSKMRAKSLSPIEQRLHSITIILEQFDKY